MKAIDAIAIGRLVIRALEGEWQYPLADRDDGYELDHFQGLEPVAGDMSRVRLWTQGGKHFRIEVTEVEPGK